MEIKSVKQENTNYPVQENITYKTLKNNIPNSWKKIGILFFIMQIFCTVKGYAAVTFSEVNASTVTSELLDVTSGASSVQSTIGSALRLGRTGIISLAAIIIIINVLSIINNKNKLDADKQVENSDVPEYKKIKRSKKIILITLLIAFILVITINLVFYFSPQVTAL